MPWLWDSDLIQIACLLVQPLAVNSVKAMFDSDKAIATPATPQGCCSSGLVAMSCGTHGNKGMALCSKAVKQRLSLPFVELTDELQVQQLFIVSLLSLQG